MSVDSRHPAVAIDASCSGQSAGHAKDKARVPEHNHHFLIPENSFELLSDIGNGSGLIF
jgi:hypothetical protein